MAGRSRRREQVLLISMPFGALERPSLALGLLQAHCRQLGVDCETRYLGIPFAERVGVGEYHWLNSDVPYTAFAGDWLFAEALYGPQPDVDAGYVDDVLRSTWQLGDDEIARLWRLRAAVEPFLAHCLSTIDWSAYTLVGFTSTFQQNIASLALAARVKAMRPDITVAFGGANWEEEMGVALHRRFSFVDLAFSGEADQSFPAVLEARKQRLGVGGIAGVTSRERPPAGGKAPAASIADIDALPVPDYHPFFDQLRSSPIVGTITPLLLVETARGCWWGERSHCTFCGLNGATMAFRSKSPERVLDEIALLCERHGVTTFSVVDDILDMRYFKSVLPKLAEARLGADFFWEVKANLTAEHVRQLRDAGVIFIQPGIESLNDNVLALMRKGTTGFRNIELLKWCREYGVQPLWNLLYGFPGEARSDYEETVALMEAIWHLEPPTGYGPIRLDRFSPYHADPAAFGMENIRPMAPFSYLYPFERAEVMEIAYYFDFDYADDRTDDVHARDAVQLALTWRADTERGMLAIHEDVDGSLYILDTHRELAAEPRRAMLPGWKASVFLACDRAATMRHLMLLPAVVLEGVTEQDVRDFLERCLRHHLMVQNERNWLNVAVHVPAREAPAEAASRHDDLEPAALAH
jgi:ribosomal peptide maturation radical SAM protein 1